MIQFKSFKQYFQVVNGIRFPNIPKHNFFITYFSENSTLIEDYPKLNIRRPDAKVVILPITKLPRTRPSKEIMKSFKSFGIRSYPSIMKPPMTQNLIYDISQYLTTIEKNFSPSNYRQRFGTFITNIISSSFSQFQNYEKILLYSVDLTKPELNTFIDRKFYPVLQQLKDDSFNFDHLILCLITPTGVKYRLLVKNRDFKLQKIITFLRSIKLLSSMEEIIEDENETNETAQKVMNHIEKHIEPKNKEQVHDAIKTFIKKDEIVKDKINSDLVSSKDMPKIAAASILYKISGNLRNSNKIVNSIPREKAEKALTNIDKRYSDQILQSKNPQNTSDDVLVKSSNVPVAVSNKSPNHLFEKRLIDFKTNLHNDINNSFKVLETKDLPFKLSKLEITDKPYKKGEIERSDLSLVKTTLKDSFGKTHNIQIEIPKIDPQSGTFRINGQRKCLLNQLILCPITFPKPYESRFQSSYSIFRIRSKKTRNQEYLEIFLANAWLPLSVLTFFSFGFENTLKQFNLGYEISKEKPKKTDEFVCKIDSENYLYFKVVDTQLKKEFCNSFISLKPDKFIIKKEFGSKDYFNDLIIEITGRQNSTYLILSNLENIVDPVARQVLINQQLPSTLNQIIYYMSSKVVIGFVQDRNDITNQRIRGSEVLVHFIQKQILAAYTDYKGKVLGGNKDAELIIKPTETLSNFIRCEIVSNMEYANPIEEMAVMTRVSPIGKDIGGIPDKDAIQDEGRNVHSTYFGNIDPLDTPEGPMIGISQQLAIGALITSARGMFGKKEFSNSEKSGMLSTTSCMIPFIENNDGARMIMATNQAKQMIPLKNPEPPAVRSGYESLLTNVLSENFIKKSPCDGKIIKVDSDSIHILCKDKKIQEVSLTPVHLKSGSGKDTLSIFRPVVKLNQIVKEKQIIAEGSCISNGSISLGRTLCVAVMPYEGFNFEDGIVINEKLIKDDKLTSIHGIIEEVEVFENDRVLEIAKIGEYIEKGKPIFKKTIGEIEQMLGVNEEDDSEEKIGQHFIKKSPGGIVVDIEVFCNLDDSKFPLLKDLISKTRRKYNTPKTQKFTVKKKVIDGILIKFKIEQELKINLGDKLTNRYGAKGIICLVEKDEMMPRTPWGDTVDIIVNPIGIIGRANIGQLFEMYTGLISRDLGVRISTLKTKPQILNLLKKIYPILDASNNKVFSSNLLRSLSSLSDAQFSIFVNQVKKTGFCPIIIPPFQAPNQKQILEALHSLGHKSGYQLFLPKYGIKTKSNVPIGYMYFSKLEHLGAEKIYGRSTGPVTKTLQPTSGKKREGAQRLGEADTYCLISYNCPTVLAELMGPLSDDATTKNEIISEIIETGEATYRDTKISPARDLLNSYFVSLILENVGG